MCPQNMTVYARLSKEGSWLPAQPTLLVFYVRSSLPLPYEIIAWWLQNSEGYSEIPALTMCIPVPPSFTPIAGGHCPVAGRCWYPGQWVLLTTSWTERKWDGRRVWESRTWKGSLGHICEDSYRHVWHFPSMSVYLSLWTCDYKKILNSMLLNYMHMKKIYCSWNYCSNNIYKEYRAQTISILHIHSLNT